MVEPQVRLDIYSDPICPWCFIGKRRLERALADRPALSVRRHWRPFQLNPDMPAEGMDRQTYLATKFGGAGNAARVYDMVAQHGAAEDLPFAFERIARTPNTLAAHQLIAWAADEGDCDPLIERLFRAYFFEGRDIGDPEVLAEIAAETGLDPASARAAVTESDLRGQVAAEDARARQAGLQGVPTFVVNGAYAVSGAQEPKVLHQLFDLAVQAPETAAP